MVWHRHHSLRRRLTGQPRGRRACEGGQNPHQSEGLGGGRCGTHQVASTATAATSTTTSTALTDDTSLATIAAAQTASEPAS